MTTFIRSLLIFSCLAGLLFAQDPVPQTIGNPDIDPAELALRLKAFTADELKVEADGWQGLLKEVTAGLSEAQISKSPEEKLAPLRSARDAVADRMDTVINELGVKGGEIEGYQAYVKATGNRVDLEANNPSAFLDRIKSWGTNPDGGLKMGMNILKFLIILFLAKIVANIIARIVRKVLNKSGKSISDLLKDFIVNSVRKVVFLFGLVMALSALGVNIGPLLAGLGVFGFVIGFALQDTLSNFAAGFMILLNGPYDIGDLVEVDGKQGIVTAMSLVSTTINTLDNQKIIIPNGKIWGGTINNITGNDTRRVDLMFGIDYGDDTDKAKQILKEICDESDLILKDPGPDIEVHELGDSAVNILCRPWCKTSDYWNVHWYVTNNVKKRFDAAGLSFPFPQQDVHMHPAAAS